MDIRMIVTDLDGTLLRSDKTISERTLRAFEQCREKGIVIAAEFPSCECLSFTGEIWRRFAAVGADKVSALKKISERLGISAESIAAFGDDCNDIEMLKYCGLGIAMGNAIEEAKQAAGVICGTNDSDGLAEFIEQKM